MINQNRQQQIRDRMLNSLLHQMNMGSSQTVHPTHAQPYVRIVKGETIDIEFEDVTDVKGSTDSEK